MVTDPISDLIIRIKNAGLVRKQELQIPFSKTKYNVAQKLYGKKLLKGVKQEGHSFKKKIMIELNYDEDGKHVITDVERVSKPGRRIYTSSKQIKPYKNGLGMVILSTPKGIMTGEEARKENVGGEVLFKIW